ncbi:MAG: CpaF/VirB11 family protein [Lachnospiraceae bacterium]|nr:CpaF/VirB11 family protein [Lachnospiraceae bacterium]
MALFANKTTEGSLFGSEYQLPEETLVKTEEEKELHIEEDAVVDGIDFNILKVPIEFFEDLTAFINDKDITDIEYNSGNVWTIDIYNNVIRHDELNYGEVQVQKLIERINSSKNSEFNKISKTLETEAVTTTGESIRIKVLHSEYAQDGTELYIRKTPSYARLSTVEILKNKYATPEELSFLINVIKAHGTVLIAGEPGAGKTELGKYLSLFIDKKDHVFVIEDTNEWHIKSLRPNLRNTSVLATKDGENNTRTYADAIKDAVRCNTNWLIFSEIRGDEVVEYFNALATISGGIGTIHSPNVKGIVTKIKNMTSDAIERTRLEDEVYLNEIVGVFIQRDLKDMSRHIEQIGVFYNQHGAKVKGLLFNKSEFLDSTLPSAMLKKFERHGISNPFFAKEVKTACDNLGIVFEETDYITPQDNVVNIQSSSSVSKEIRI